MQVIVKSRHTHVPEPVKQMTQQKLDKVQRILGKITSLEVEFSEEHNPRIADKHRVEVTLATKAHVLRAHAAGPDQTSALDMVIAKLEAQVKRLKGKIVERRVRPGHVRGAAVSPPATLESPNGTGTPIQSSEDSAEVDGPEISRIKRFALKPMTAEEAVLQMESLGHDFYLFVDAESEQTGVIYKRRDGTFGLIEPA